MTEQKKIFIAFDIDDTLLASLKAILEQYHLQFTYNQVTEWDWAKLFGYNYSTLIKMYEDLDPELVFLEEHCIHGITRLVKNDAFKVYLLTDKTPKMMEWTVKVVNRMGLSDNYGIPPRIIISGQKWNNNWDILVEDKGETWEQCIERKRRCVLIDKPWNRQFQGAERYFSVNDFCHKMIQDYGEK